MTERPVLPIRRLARYAYRAMRAPAPSAERTSFLRSLLLSRRLFDLVSLYLQARDLRRLSRIATTYASSDDYVRRVHDYNAGVTVSKVITTTRRAEGLYRIAVLPSQKVSREDVLIIGPRNIHELLIAWLHGFHWSRIQAIDLYSTHPKIHVMNMEAMTFADECFDVVVMANTLAYAADTGRCLAEIARVLRPGGRVVFGATYDPGDETWAGTRVSGEQIRGLLSKVSLDLYYYSPNDKVNSLGRLQTVHVFGATKPPALAPGFDRIRW
jgi:SAM-dependent methyltransferase